MNEASEIMDKQVDQATAITTEHIEAMAVAYLKLTGLPADQVTLCHEVGQDGVMRWWFEPRATENTKPLPAPLLHPEPARRAEQMREAVAQIKDVPVGAILPVLQEDGSTRWEVKR